MMYRNLPYIKL